jgi:hypothetical protein
MLSVALEPTQPPVQFGFTQGLSGQVIKLSTHFHLVLRLRMSGTLPLLLPYTFMALTGRTLHFYLLWVKVVQKRENTTAGILAGVPLMHKYVYPTCKEFCWLLPKLLHHSLLHIII